MELSKYGGERVISFIPVLFIKNERGEEILSDWNLSYMFSILKKGDKRSINYYGGIIRQLQKSSPQ